MRSCGRLGRGERRREFWRLEAGEREIQEKPEAGKERRSLKSEGEEI